MRRTAAILFGSLAWLAPAAAFACPVCFDPNEANRNVWLGATILLSLLPLAFIGSVVWVLRMRAQEAELAEAATAVDRDAP